MRIVIADDEKLVRFSLRSMIEELSLPLTVAAEATTGTELKQALAEHKPDIAIVDIKMPGMSGLEAMADVIRDYSDLEWVVLTGYSEFTYARTALSLGATDYLMKPASPEEVERVLTRLMESRTRLYLARSSEYESRLSAILSGTAQQSSVEAERGDRHVGALIVVDSCRDAQTVRQLRREIADAVRSRLLQFAGRVRRAVVASGSRAGLAAALSWPADDRDGESIATHTLQVAGKIAAGKSSAQAIVTVITTPVASSLDEWLKQLAGAQDSAKGRPVGGAGFIEEAGKLGGLVAAMPPAVARLSRVCLELARSYAERDSLSYLQRVEELRQLLQSGREALSSLDFTPVVRFLQAAVGYPDAPSEHLAQLGADRRIEVGKLRSRVENGPPDTGDERSQALAGQIAGYVERNYMADLSITALASHFGVTPNYLSTLFGRGHGETFLRFVTRIRMERASQLLLDRNLQIQQVARLVGYSNPRHFSRVFRTHFGHTPGEHQDRRGNGE